MTRAVAPQQGWGALLDTPTAPPAFVNVHPGFGQMLASVTVLASVTHSLVVGSYRIVNFVMPPGKSMNLP